MSTLENKTTSPATTSRPLAERSIFALQELLKLRRLTRPQFATLCRMSDDPQKSKFPIYRLCKKDLIAVDFMPIGRRSEPLLKLTIAGHRQAAISMGREHDENYRDYVQLDFLSHLLMGNDLYLRIVANGAKDWGEVRYNASCFEWLGSNEGTEFRWKAPAEFDGDKRCEKRVPPDITIETATRRFLIEIERSTKTLAVVKEKIESYSRLFSPVASSEGKPGYAFKYADQKVPCVVFVFGSEQRATHARQHFEQLAKSSKFYIPEWRCGTVETIGDALRPVLLGRPPAPLFATDTLLRYGEAIRQFATDSHRELEAIRNLVLKNAPVPMPKTPRGLPEIRELLALLKAANAQRSAA